MEESGITVHWPNHNLHMLYIGTGVTFVYELDSLHRQTTINRQALRQHS